MITSLRKQPVTAAEIPLEWTTDRREIIAREGCAVRAGLDLTIEVQSINSGAFMPLMLPSGGTRFVSSTDRDQILRALLGIMS